MDRQNLVGFKSIFGENRKLLVDTIPIGVVLFVYNLQRGV